MLRRIAVAAAAALLALVLLPGCTLSSIVRTQAAADFSCDPDHVTTEDTASGVRATGCGQSAVYNYAAQSPVKRAAYDLACSQEKLQMIDLGNRGFGVRGCGKRTTYSYVDGAWVQGALTTDP